MTRRRLVHGQKLRPAATTDLAVGAATMVSRWIFNTYIVHDGGAGGALIVDPGTPSNARDAIGVVAAFHGSNEPGAVVCTHGHVDHVAGVTDIETNTGVGYQLPAVCEGYLDRRMSPGKPGLREVAKIAPVMASQRFDPRPLWELRSFINTSGHVTDGMVMPTTPSGFLRDGDAVSGAPDREVLATPGHTEDSTCLYHRGTATLLSGDTVLTHDGRAWFNPENLSPDASSVTEERLRSLPVEHLFPGHGLPISGHDLLRRARSFRTQPTGRSISERLARSLGRWNQAHSAAIG